MIEPALSLFADTIRQRSSENRSALNVLRGKSTSSVQASILRLELDSLVRVIYLLNQNAQERRRLCDLTNNGNMWRKESGNRITDRQMVDLANNLNGWTEYVYKFGCAYIHLSNLHSFTSQDLFDGLSDDEKGDIRLYIKNYHGSVIGETLATSSFVHMIPSVFEKISNNLECYLKELVSA